MWLSLALSAAEPTIAPNGWFCRVAEELDAGSRIDIVQHVEAPGARFPLEVDVSVRTRPHEQPDQNLRWILLEPNRDLSQPWALTLQVRLKTRDAKGTIHIVHDTGITVLPVTLRSLSQLTRHKASILIFDESALRHLWASTHWRLSIRDRHGREKGSVEGALPPRSAVEQAFAKLSQILRTRQQHQLANVRWSARKQLSEGREQPTVPMRTIKRSPPYRNAPAGR